MSDPLGPKTYCRFCTGEIPFGDDTCQHCGKKQASPQVAQAVRDPRAGILARIAGLVGTLVLLFITAVAATVMAKVTASPACEAASPFVPGDCFDGSAAARLLTLILGWPAALLGGVSAVLGFVFTLTGRRGARVVLSAMTAVALFVLSVVIARVG